MSDTIDIGLKKEKRTVEARAVKLCVKCGQWKDHAARELCFACYRAETRSKVKPIDRYAQSMEQTKETKKLLRSYSAMMSAMVDFHVTAEDIASIQSILRRYTTMIQPYWQPTPTVDTATREREQIQESCSRSPFNVGRFNDGQEPNETQENDFDLYC